MLSIRDCYANPVLWDIIYIRTNFISEEIDSIYWFWFQYFFIFPQKPLKTIPSQAKKYIVSYDYENNEKAN